MISKCPALGLLIRSLRNSFTRTSI